MCFIFKINKVCYMCITTRVKRGRRNKIHRVYPKPPPRTFTTDEVLECGGCNGNFPLSDIKINCAGCDNFFHCKVAGTCYGKNCQVETFHGEKHRECWCTNCVPPLPVNRPKNNREDRCICKKCYKY